MPRPSSKYSYSSGTPYTGHHHYSSPTLPRRTPPPSSSSPPSSPSSMKLKTLIHEAILPRIALFLRALSKLKSAMSRAFQETDHFLHYLWESELAVDMIKNRRSGGRKYRKKVLFGSFRLHYNWCSSSSHVRPIDFISSAPSSVRNSYSATAAENQKQMSRSFHSSSGQIYYDSTWNNELFTTTTDGDYGTCYRSTGDGQNGVGGGCGGGVSARRSSRRDLESPYAQQLSSYLQWLEEKGQHQDSNNEIKMMNEIDQLADMFIASCHEKFRLEKIESYRRYQEMLARSM